MRVIITLAFLFTVCNAFNFSLTNNPIANWEARVGEAAANTLASYPRSSFLIVFEKYFFPTK